MTVSHPLILNRERDAPRRARAERITSRMLTIEQPRGGAAGVKILRMWAVFAFPHRAGGLPRAWEAPLDEGCNCAWDVGRCNPLEISSRGPIRFDHSR